jgi:hypothetical protein
MSGVAICSFFHLKLNLFPWAIYVTLHQEWCEIILYLLLFQFFARVLQLVKRLLQTSKRVITQTSGSLYAFLTTSYGQ